jgi:catechol 2,3-dioxygenase-like lactoylglutathione lyase family enzyme
MTDQPVKPSLAIPVANLAGSLAFYTDCLGFTLAEQQPAPDAAHMIDSDGDPLPLVGPHAGDVTPYLAESHVFTRPGQTINFLGDDLDVRRAALLQKGLTDVQVVEKRWGDRSLLVKDPDGYTLQFIANAPRSSEEGLALYARGPQELEAALAGLSEADLLLSRETGEWSIRAIVGHLAGTETLFAPSMEMALAESGRTYHPNWPISNQRTAKELDYAGRPIEPSLALIRAVHAHILQVAQHVPGAWERYVQDPSGRKRRFGDLVTIVATIFRSTLTKFLKSDVSMGEQCRKYS